MKRVLLTGGAGFLGRNFREAFAAAAHEVAVVDRVDRISTHPHHGVALADDERLFGLMHALRTDVVVHLACGLLPSSGAAEFAREQREVIEPTFRLMTHCARIGVRFVLLSSGGTVYGDTIGGRVHEDHPLAPKNYYGFSKVVLEEYARLCHRMNGLQYLILRPSNPYGRHQRMHGAQGLVAVALGRVLSGQPLEIWGDGSSVRDYLDVRDLSAAVVALVNQDIVNCSLNIGSGVGHSINQVLALVREASGRDLQVVRWPERGVDVRSIVLDTTALAATIAWQPRALTVGIQDFYSSISPTDVS